MNELATQPASFTGACCRAQHAVLVSHDLYRPTHLQLLLLRANVKKVFKTQANVERLLVQSIQSVKLSRNHQLNATMLSSIRVNHLKR